MDKEQKIRFSATDSGVSTFMKKLQNDTKALYSEFLKEAQKQTLNQKEQLKIVEQQIKALERQNNLEKEQNRIILERRRAAGYITGVNFVEQSGRLKADTAVNSVQTSILKDMLSTMKDSQKREDQPATSKQVFSAVLMAGVIRDVLSTLKQTATAQTGLDLLTPMASAAGAGIGAASGLFLLPSLAAAGKEVGGFAGTAYTRQIRTQEEYARAVNAYGAFTGGSLNLPSFSGMGFSGIDAMSRAGGIAGAAGRRLNGGDIATFLGLNRGFGINEGVMNEAFAGERTGGGSGTSRMQRVLGVAIAEGLDRAKFTDAIKNQNQLLAQFAQTSTNVSDDRINRILFEFNRMGGMFRIGDPRSMGIISSLNQSLSSPQGGFNQAMNYSVLRKLSPNSSIYDLIGQQERGLQTPGFFKGVLDQYGRMGVSEDFQKIMFKQRFGLNNEAIDTIFSNRGSLENMTQNQLNKILGQGRITNEAEQRTNRLTRYEAETSDAFRESMLKGISTISIQFRDEMGKAIKDIAELFKTAATSGIREQNQLDIMGGPGGAETQAPFWRTINDFLGFNGGARFRNAVQELQTMPHKNQSRGK